VGNQKQNERNGTLTYRPTGSKAFALLGLIEIPVALNALLFSP
jgi:hypothetical protein